MRKSILFLIFISSLLAFSCSEKNAEKDSVQKSSKNISIDKKEIQYEEYEFLDPEEFFTLDYRPEQEEESFEKTKVSLEYPEAKGEKSTSFIPPLRNLSEYKTEYHEKRLSYEEREKILNQMKSEAEKEKEANENDTTEKKSASKEKAKTFEEEARDAETSPFIVKDWGPKNQVPSAIKNPEFYVEFNYPFNSLTSLKNDEKFQKEAEEIMEITPKISGKYKLYGTRNISFEADEPLSDSEEYTITISPKLKSIGGQTLSGENTFKVKAEKIKLTRIEPGIKNENSYSTYSEESGLSLEKAKYARIWFSGFLTEEDAKKRLHVSMQNKYENKELSFQVAGNFSKYTDAEFTSDNKWTNSFYTTIDSPLEKDSTILISFDSNSEKSYSTEKPFRIQNSYESSSSWDSSPSWVFSFNQNIDKNTVMSSISVDGADFSEKNVSAYGSTIRIHGLKIKPLEIATVKLNENLKNIYGSSLQKGTEAILVGRYANGYARFTDYGTKMLESQFPHKVVFEYMNISSESEYKVSQSFDPLYAPGWKEYWTRSEGGGKKFASGELNTRQFEEILLDPYLDNGKGFVKIETDIGTLDNEYGNSKYDFNTHNFLNIQVTDLAATCRYALNKAIVMVKTLSDDKPVEGAKVYFKSYDSEKNKMTSNFVLTDKNGIATLDGNKNYQRLFTNYSDDYNVALIVETEDDEIAFKPIGHYEWKGDVYQNGIFGAFSEKQRTFMFTDRGLYKPGETVTFKGIDRNQKMGSFIPYIGEFSVTIEKNAWDDNTIYAVYSGETSASGGFWGTFDIDENLEPGSYSIKYKRNGNDDLYSISFDVAFFEKLKIQGSIETEEKDIYAGENVNAKLKASYLAGGYLSGSEYKASWYSIPTEFVPKGKEFSDYSFSLSSYFSDDYEGRKFINSEKGILSSKGEAKLSCSTQGNLKATPYLYTVESYVTDESNQEISVRASKIVHPSLFYIGIGKNENSNGFAKQGEKLSFPFVVITPDEKYVEDKSLYSSQIKYTFSRHYWTYDYQNSVDDSIYKRYTEHTDEEETGEIKMSQKGKIHFTPKNSGYYTLRTEAKDKEGRLSVSERNFYVTGSNASCFFNDDSSEINLTPSKNIYNPGETAQILLESPLSEGDYLICVEREGIFTNEVRHIKENTCVLEIPIARNYVPVCYVTVSSYSKRNGQPTHQYGEKDIGKPKGYFGVTPVFVNPMVRAFSIHTECDKPSYKPGDEATIKIKATKGGKPLSNAEITVMGVDRAVLDLIDYHVPNPIEYFYDAGNFPLCVRGGDSRNYLMDPVTYSVKNLQGGDEDSEKDENERKDFRPTAFFEPAIFTDENGYAEVSFKVPDSLTTYRVTAFGVHGELLSIREDEFIVQNPINAQAVQPKTLRERDTAECGVLLTNLDSETREVTVKASIRFPRKNNDEDETMGVLTENGNAFIDGENTHTVKVAQGSSSVVYFDIAAEKKGDIEIVYEIESASFAEKLVSRLKIEKTYFMETVALQGSSEYLDKSSFSAVEGVVIPSYADDANGSLSLTLDATRLGLLGSSVKYLFDYPYGCLEQQTAKMLPLVIFEDYIDSFGMESKIKNVRKCVKTYFKSWKDSQNEDGGFPYWPNEKGDFSSDIYVSLRMAHIYKIAMERGYSKKDFPIDIESLLLFIQKSFENKAEPSSYISSYALYVFSLYKNHSLDYLYQTLEEDTEKNHAVAALTSLSYLNFGENAKANALASRIRSYIRPTLRSVDITEPLGYENDSYWNTKTGETALILNLFASLNPEDEMVTRLIYSLLSECSSGYWESTATTAKVLEAFYQVIRRKNLGSTDLNGKATLNGINLIDASFKGSNAEPVTLTKNFKELESLELKKDEAIPLRLDSNGKGTLYYTAELSYAVPDEIQTERNQGFDVSYSIKEYDSEKQISPCKNDMVYEIESGKTYIMSVKVSSTKDAHFVAGRIPVPSGAEILNPEFETSGTKAEVLENNSGFSNTVIYENELQCFWNKFEKGEKTFSFAFRANRRGVYPVPPVKEECMYSKEYFGCTNGYIFTIK